MGNIALKAAHFASATLNNPWGVGSLSFILVFVPVIGMWTAHIPMTGDTLDELLPLLEGGDIIIDHSSSDIKKCQKLEKYCSKLGISYIFSGTYGAPYAIDACSKIFQCLSAGNIK